MFWKRCVGAECVIVPLKVYSKFSDDRRISDNDCEGIKFVALPLDTEVVGPDFFFIIEESLAGDYPRFDTPEAALEEYESRKLNG